MSLVWILLSSYRVKLASTFDIIIVFFVGIQVVCIYLASYIIIPSFAKETVCHPAMFLSVINTLDKGIVKLKAAMKLSRKRESSRNNEPE